MAGMSSRFFKAGYTQPKYMLEAKGKPLFDHAVESFKHYFNHEKFVFIIRDIHGTKDFVERRARILEIKDFDIVVLKDSTRGQAETVALGLASLNVSSESITIFNIDTFRPNFIYPTIVDSIDGYLEVFKGEGDNWSFVRPLNSNETQVSFTTEKNPVSDLCCTGLYFFKYAKDFFDAYNNYLSLPESEWEKGELYVAPLYNYLINKGLRIHYHQIEKDEVIFCGIPKEYNDFL